MNDTTVKSIRFKNTMIDKINILAAQDNRNFSNMVETLLLRALRDK